MGDPSRPAFPVPMIPFDGTGGYTEIRELGLTKREWFAGMALKGLLANPGGVTKATDAMNLVSTCFLIADAMLKEAEDA